ncbi:MAG TPA: hypothetical protein VMX18_04265 [Candidatus Bipolaricaulota bacterium]|nr:hypothetical protein [Candidatus Bipolaricaulota bacterium]
MKINQNAPQLTKSESSRRNIKIGLLLILIPIIIFVLTSWIRSLDYYKKLENCISYPERTAEQKLQFPPEVSYCKYDNPIFYFSIEYLQTFSLAAGVILVPFGIRYLFKKDKNNVIKT